jgi:hypothetical protein
MSMFFWTVTALHLNAAPSLPLRFPESRKGAESFFPPFPLPKNPPQELPGGGFRNLGRDLHDARIFIRRHSLLTEVDGFFRDHSSPEIFFQRHKSFYGLSPVGIRNPDDRRLFHRRVLVENIFPVPRPPPFTEGIP